MKNIIILATLFLNLSVCSADLAYITNPQQSDGFGSQFQGIIAAAIYAELAHKQFIYTPFQSMEHNYDNDPAFLAQKEEFINFIGNFELNTGQYPASRNAHYKAILDKYPDLCAQSVTLAKIKQIFRENKDADYFKNNRFNIAIHLRRPNQHDSRVEGTDTPDTLFLAIIDALRTWYADKNPLFHLYSLGKATTFAAYKADDIVFHLNESVEDSFLGFVFADVLVTSASSFSYTAALLSDGTIYYVPFWHTPFPGWVSVHELIKSVNLAER
jgi:hypothetical protein